MAIARGLGVGVVAYWRVKELIEAGELAIVMPDAQLKPRPIRALWAPPRQLPTRTRLFVEFLAKRLSSQAL